MPIRFGRDYGHKTTGGCPPATQGGIFKNRTYGAGLVIYEGLVESPGLVYDGDTPTKGKAMGKPLIGSRREAAMLLAEEDSYGEPDGWEFLGAGCYRSAYLAPSGVVYKIGHDSGNRQEASTAQRLRKLNIPGIYIPKTSSFNFEVNTHRHRRTIVAMEYIDGEHPDGCWVTHWNGQSELYCYCGQYAEGDEGVMHINVPACEAALFMDTIKSKVPLSDIHCENVIRMSDGRIAVIDLQM